ncbi:hypothetical protein LTR53_011783, partial [Teratosphaeriaceae sp. CCFEE 6253]
LGRAAHPHPEAQRAVEQEPVVREATSSSASIPTWTRSSRSCCGCRWRRSGSGRRVSRRRGTRPRARRRWRVCRRKGARQAVVGRRRKRREVGRLGGVRRRRREKRQTHCCRIARRIRTGTTGWIRR